MTPLQVVFTERTEMSDGKNPTERMADALERIVTQLDILIDRSLARGVKKLQYARNPPIAEIIAAAEALLVGGPMPVARIAMELEKGGMEFFSVHPVRMISTVLYRERKRDGSRITFDKGLYRLTETL